MRSWANSMMLGELRVAMSLARLWRDQGKVSEAREQRITLHRCGVETLGPHRQWGPNFERPQAKPAALESSEGGRS
jgi:hypothetical protein